MTRSIRDVPPNSLPMLKLSSLSAGWLISLVLAFFYTPYFWVTLAPVNWEARIVSPILPGIATAHTLDTWRDGAINWATGSNLLFYGTVLTLAFLGASLLLVAFWRTRREYALAITAIVSSALSYQAYRLVMS